MSAAQVTEAHKTLTERVCELLDSEDMVGPSPVERAAQLIADSEARAVGLALTGITCTHHTDKERHECPVCLVTQLRAEVEKAKGYINLQVARAETAEREVERLRQGSIAVHQSNVSKTARAERAEAELATVRSENNRLREDTCAQTIEGLRAELAKARVRLDWAYLNSEKFGALAWGAGKTINDAIDAAMKEDGT